MEEIILLVGVVELDLAHVTHSLVINVLGISVIGLCFIKYPKIQVNLTHYQTSLLMSGSHSS
jgi:hypothetical protein